MSANTDQEKGWIAWVARNRVTANLAMLILLVGGLITGLTIKQEIFPNIAIPYVEVWISYPGATPSETEKGITLAAEEAITALEEVKKVQSGSLEGGGWLVAELHSDVDEDKGLEKIRKSIDGVSFPAGAEKPHINLITIPDKVLSLVLYGEVPQKALLDFADEIRDNLLLRPHINRVEVSGVAGRQISVEIPQEVLQRYNLSLNAIAHHLTTTTQQVATGKVKSDIEEILLSTSEPYDRTALYSDVVIFSHPNGGTIRLGDIADIKEEPQDSRQETLFNGKPAVRLDLFRIGNSTPGQVSNSALAFIEELRQQLPEGVFVDMWEDHSEIFRDRIDLLGRNALMGLALVLLLLGLFLDLRLAFWVTLGIPVSVVGSLLFLPTAGATINMVSLFAFIVTLGIVVDDALVVGEIIHQKRESGMNALSAAIAGAKEIATPVTFAVLTNIAAFAPLYFIPGPVGLIYRQIPAVVIVVFTISLVESLFILPNHLSHQGKEKGVIHFFNQRRRFIDHWLQHFVDRFYIPSLKKCLHYHLATLSAGIGMLMISVGCVVGGYIPYTYMPTMENENVKVTATLPFGAKMEHAQEAARALNDTATEVMKTLGSDNFRGIYSFISPIFPSAQGPTGSYSVLLDLALAHGDLRNVNASEVAALWRDLSAGTPGVESIAFETEIGPGNIKPIVIQLSHRSTDVLNEAAKEVAKALKNYSGVIDIQDGISGDKSELALELRSEAKALGMTTQGIASQIRSAFVGTEALRERRGRHELPVVIRLPQQEREQIHTLENMLLHTPTGGTIPLSDAAKMQSKKADTTIRRDNGRRSINITADVEKGINSNTIVAELRATVAPKLINLYPGLQWDMGGQFQEAQDVQGALAKGFLLAMIAIYALLAIPFQSYLQPLIVMLSIPFGIVGALLGHLLLGYELSVISVMGIIALSGVVVNDSLVLVVTANNARDEEGLSHTAALVKAAKTRFRPIILTSLTTFFGLVPMIFETSLQARFLIPMAISLGFGILFSTLIILFLCPAAYLLLTRKKSPHWVCP